jgi:hypothetical protein
LPCQRQYGTACAAAATGIGIGSRRAIDTRACTTIGQQAAITGIGGCTYDNDTTACTAAGLVFGTGIAVIGCTGATTATHNDPL